MAQDEYFSFGDEDLGGDLEVPDLEEDQLLGGSAVALADPPEHGLDELGHGLNEPEGGLDELEDPSSAAKRAARPRGDSKRASSARRGPSSRRMHLLAATALAVFALVVGRATIGAIDASGPAAPARDVAVGSERAVEETMPANAAAERLRASRERAAEQQQVRQRRAKTRHRARRSRDRRAAQRERRAETKQRKQKAQEASGASEEIPTEYIPPAPEAAPETTPEPEPSPPPSSSEAGLQDGANSPEFGL